MVSYQPDGTPHRTNASNPNGFNLLKSWATDPPYLAELSKVTFLYNNRSCRSVVKEFQPWWGRPVVRAFRTYRKFINRVYDIKGQKYAHDLTSWTEPYSEDDSEEDEGKSAQAEFEQLIKDPNAHYNFIIGAIDEATEALRHPQSTISHVASPLDPKLTPSKDIEGPPPTF